jgi:hypothetical protein
MNPSEEVIENPSEKKSPAGVKAISIFTFIAKSLLLLLSIGFLLGLFLAEDYMVNKIKDSEQSSADWLLETKIYCLVYILSCLGAIIGAVKMRKGKKKGFYLHAISNTLLIAFLVYNANIVEYIFAASLLFFIILYLPFMKKLS